MVRTAMTSYYFRQSHMSDPLHVDIVVLGGARGKAQGYLDFSVYQDTLAASSIQPKISLYLFRISYHNDQIYTGNRI